MVQPIPSAERRVVQREDIDPAWLTELLSGTAPGVRVAAVSTETAYEGMSTAYRLRVDYMGDNMGLPPVMIAKGGFGRHTEWDWVYETEMIAYRDFLPLVDVPRPKTFFAGHEPAAGSPVLLFEDLTTRDVRFNDVRTPLSYAQAAHFLDAMAHYHARFWNSPDLGEGGSFAWTIPLLGGALLESYVPYVTASPQWEAFLQMPRGMVLPRLFRDGDRMRRGLLALADRHRAGPQCIIHGDCHFGNSYLEADGSPGLLDWQIKRGAWQQDVTYFLISALDIVDRRAWERPLIDHYLARLASHGVTPPGAAEAWLSYRCEILYGLMIWLCNGDDNSQYQKEYINTGNTARFAAAALDHDTLAVLGI